MPDSHELYYRDFEEDVEECEFDGMIQIDGEVYYT